jgi:hypothetical protein
MQYESSSESLAATIPLIFGYGHSRYSNLHNEHDSCGKRAAVAVRQHINQIILSGLTNSGITCFYTLGDRAESRSDK